jgi:hypothetical protein
VPHVLQRCLGISRLSRRMFVIVSLGGGQSFEPRIWKVWDLSPMADRTHCANFFTAGAFRVGKKRVSFPDRQAPFSMDRRTRCLHPPSASR